MKRMKLDWDKISRRARKACNGHATNCCYRFGICRCEFAAIKKEVILQLRAAGVVK